jgi:hypothetical protein
MRYVLLAQKMRIQRGPGNADLVVERPAINAADGSGIRGYLDDPDGITAPPTLVEFDDLCQINVEKAIKSGAFREYIEPAKSTRTTRTAPDEGGSNG